MLKLYHNIKKYRLTQKISQEVLAEKMGYSDKSMISKIENGKVDMSYSQILKCAEIFGIPADALMGFSIPEAYNEASPDTRAAVCAVLGVRKEDT